MAPAPYWRGSPAWSRRRYARSVREIRRVTEFGLAIGFRVFGALVAVRMVMFTSSQGVVVIGRTQPGYFQGLRVPRRPPTAP